MSMCVCVFVCVFYSLIYYNFELYSSSVFTHISFQFDQRARRELRTWRLSARLRPPRPPRQHPSTRPGRPPPRPRSPSRSPGSTARPAWVARASWSRASPGCR